MRRGVFVTADECYVARAGEAGGVVRLSEWTGEPCMRLV